MSGSAVSMGPGWRGFGRKSCKRTCRGSITASEAVAKAGTDKFDLILVNRVLAADGTEGLDVIDALIAKGVTSPVILVSDRKDAQDEAVEHGAARGFGKADLDDPGTVEMIRAVATGKKRP